MKLLLLVGCDQEVKGQKLLLDYFWNQTKNVKTKLTKERSKKDGKVDFSADDEELANTGGRTNVLLQTVVEITKDNGNLDKAVEVNDDQEDDN